MKKELLYTLALPVLVYLITGCSHLPAQNTASAQKPAPAPMVASTPPPIDPLAELRTASGATPDPGKDALAPTAAVVGQSKPQPAASKLPGPVPECPEVGLPSQAAAELSAADCAPGDVECYVSEKEPPADKEAQAAFEEALDFCDVAQTMWQKGEIDNALDSLDKAYTLIVEVDPQQNPKLMQQKEDLRFLIAKRILEIYASRNIAVSGGHNEIPLQQNPDIDAELKLFTAGFEKEAFVRAYQRSGRYRPYILQALKEAGLPEELSWLPLIESGFKVKALSPARALGLWQFIPSTGYKFGLKRNNFIDERIDFVKSTQAAIAYLKELHNLFGDWSTVLAAYNCGEGRVLQVIRSQNVNYLDNFWDLYQRLPRETARYVPRFFATLHIVKNPEQYGLDKVALEQPLDWDEVGINRQVHLREISSILGAEFNELEAFNPELRFNILPPEPYTLRVPRGKSELLLASLDSLPTCSLPNVAEKTYVQHLVRKGETLAVIARRYRVTPASILRANNLRRKSSVRAGLSLKIPVRSAPLTLAAPRTSASPAVHVVARGDTLFSIANRYNTTVKQISSLNNLPQGGIVQIGQKLKLPGAQAEPDSKAKPSRTYHVQKGDSLSLIAQKHNIPLERFLSINGLAPGSTIHPGQKLAIE